jgi:hypothetical protein
MDALLHRLSVYEYKTYPKWKKRKEKGGKKKENEKREKKKKNRHWDLNQCSMFLRSTAITH